MRILALDAAMPCNPDAPPSSGIAAESNAIGQSAPARSVHGGVAGPGPVARSILSRCRVVARRLGEAVTIAHPAGKAGRPVPGAISRRCFRPGWTVAGGAALDIRRGCLRDERRGGREPAPGLTPALLRAHRCRVRKHPRRAIVTRTVRAPPGAQQRASRSSGGPGLPGRAHYVWTPSCHLSVRYLISAS